VRKVVLSVERSMILRPERRMVLEVKNMTLRGGRNNFISPIQTGLPARIT
jgi:hypothetical protein